MSDVKELNINNTTYDIKAKSVVDTNNGKLKFWSGTRAEYDAIATKDANTLYNITDDSNPTLSMLELLYPVGSIYIGTMSACPLQTLGVGTWQLVAQDRVLQGAGTRGSVGNTLNESLPNHQHVEQFPFSEGVRGLSSRINSSQSAGGIKSLTSSLAHTNDGDDQSLATQTDGVYNNSTYQNNAPVQQDAYLVNIWERIS